ncbi:hypothetical protein PC129_g13702 [Phytophthora cactorum]|uniref:Uncharacterized protein n=1 Tax=Phytophthora cactorum TaxID=29920 RepID=A0A8T1DMF5_9STRA|nr:hypothetical protein Pcac1_g12101 [Phytophthora cactorum]KAG2827664.1 hypothetical protein PC111_g8502 [Phytophthora cactorum]KAG2908137.1 hypothetical protein PC114_g10573 [Phytophthora cactorum]KAG2923334.1 hypothetical protein PC115_g8980 [Phytophthora cactorum]KAG2940853.1 hypothetical protein PC117_g10412 [Phytophthora cactorum]
MSEDEATSTRAHLSGDDYRIVSWMENKKNFDAINGYKGKTSVGALPTDQCVIVFLLQRRDCRDICDLS